MADSYVPVTPSTDPTADLMQTYENTVSGNSVQAEAVVLVDSSGSPITTLPVSISANVSTAITKFTGAPNLANGQVVMTTTPTTIVSANATRRSVTIRHIGSTLNIFIGTPTVTSSTGMLLRTGDSISVDYVGVIQGVASANSVNIAYMETYD